MNKKKVLYFSALLTFFSYFVFAENTISLQGRVLDKNGNPLNGDYSFIVRFWVLSESGDFVDFERTVEFVEVKDGFYSIEISTSASFDKEYWVEIGVKPQGSQDNYEFFPRYKLTSSPYAIRSRYSEYAKYTTGLVSTSAISMGGYPILNVSTMSVSVITSTSPATMPLVISTSVYIVGYASATKFFGDGSGLTNIEQIIRLTSDVSTTGTGFTNITGLSFTAEANKTYIFEAFLIYTTAATTTGINLAVNGPISPNAIVGEWRAYTASTTSALRTFNTYDLGTAASGSLSGNNYAIMNGILVNGSNTGTFVLRFASEVAGSNVTIKAGSILRYRKIE